MSGSERKKQKRNLKIRGIISVLILAFALLVFMVTVYDALKFGVNAQVIQYGFALIVLFFAAGVIGAPVVKYLSEGNK